MQLFFVYIPLYTLLYPLYTLLYPLYTFIYPPPYIFRQSPVRSASAPYYLLVPLPQQYRCHGNIRHPFCKKDDMSENPHISLIHIARTTKNTNFLCNFTSGWRGIISLRKSAETTREYRKNQIQPIKREMP